MNKSEFESEVLEHLRRTAIMALSTIDDCFPQVAYVLFTADAEFNFYFATRPSTAKVKSINKNNRVSLTTGIARPFNVQASGLAEVVSDQDESARILNDLAKVGAGIDNFWPPLLHMGDEEYLVYRVKTDWVRVLDLRSSIINEPKSIFRILKG